MSFEFCTFCGKSSKEVSRLVVNDKDNAICDECLVVAFAKMIKSPVKFAEPKDAGKTDADDFAGTDQCVDAKSRVQ